MSHSDADLHGHSHNPAAFDRAFAVGIDLNIGFVAIEAFYGRQADFLALPAGALHERFEISHPTLQVEISRCDQGCAPQNRSDPS